MSTIRAKTFARGSAIRVTEFIVTTVVTFGLMPFIIRTLGDAMYGLWVFVGSFIGYYYVMDFGLWSAVQRYVSQAIGGDDRDEINRIVNTALVIFSGIGFLVFALSLAIAWGIPLAVHNITEVATFRKAVIMLGFGTALIFPLSIFTGVLRAHIRYDITSSVALLKVCIRAGLIIIFLRTGGRFITLVFITFVMDVAQYVTYYFFARRLYPYLKISRKLFAASRVKKLFGYGIYTFIAQLADQLRFNIDNLVIVIFIGLSPVTLYSIGARFIRNFMLLMSSAMGMAMPLFSQYEGKGDYDSIREKYLFLMKVSSYLAVLIGGVLIILGKPFIIRWVGAQYSEAYRILLILLIPFIFDVMQIPGNNVLYGISKHRYYTISNSIEGVCNLVLSLILVRFYGLYGVALGTAIPMFIMKAFIQPVYTCKVLGLRARRFYIGVMLPVFLLSSVTLISLWMVGRMFISSNYLAVFTLASLISVLFAAVVYVFGFAKEERVLLKKAIPFKAAV